MKSKTTTTNKQTLWEVNNEYNKPVVFIGVKQQRKEQINDLYIKKQKSNKQRRDKTLHKFLSGNG